MFNWELPLVINFFCPPPPFKDAAKKKKMQLDVDTSLPADHILDLWVIYLASFFSRLTLINTD